MKHLLNHKRWSTTLRLIASISALGFAQWAAAAGSPPVPQLTWQPCEGEGNTECTLAKVPLDYDNPRGATIDLFLARVPATDQVNKIGTIFVNPGGPGASGADLARFGFGKDLMRLLGGKFDVVGFDPRGIAGSTPLQCWNNQRQQDRYFEATPIYPYRADQERAYFRAYDGMAPLCMGRSQPIMRHMSTADVARDMDLLRQAVGDRKLTYLGFSWGSHLGNSYANQFPDKVRALVIDGVLDPRLWSSGRQIESDRTATDKVFAEFVRLCDKAGTQCPLKKKGRSSSGERFEAILDNLRKAPLDLGDGEAPLTYDELIDITVGAMYGPDAWPGLADFLDSVADIVEPGGANAASASRARQGLRQLQSLLKDRKPALVDKAVYDNGLEGFYGSLCSDARFPDSLDDFREVNRFASRGSTFGPYWWWSNAACASWPVAKDRFKGYWGARTSAPVLVVGNFFDPATDYAGAVNSSRLLPGSRLLSYAGWGHTAFGFNDCVTDHVVKYVKNGTLPPRGVVCAANPSPFDPVASAAARSLKAGEESLRLDRPIIRPPRPGSR